MRHEKLIEKHLGINTPDWVKEKVNNAIDEALGYNLKKSEELTPHIEYHRNGNVYIKGQKNSKGQQEGLWELFDFNGNIKARIPFKEGKMDGIEECFWENGNIRIRTPYKDGKEDGIVEEFDEQGNIIRTQHWKNGQLIEETKPELTPYIIYHPNGNVSIKGQRNSVGQREGIWEIFYENGNILRRTSYKEGNKDGIAEYFYENGNIESRTSYKEGKKDGIQTFYDEQGNIIETTLWKDGEIIEETKPKPQPDPQLIDFMAMRYRHDFGFLDEKHKESIRTTMKQLWEEVVGLGFYKPKSK
jgi:antitoxin component YwqK of YwqJK toxin-antitoxin module